MRRMLWIGDIAVGSGFGRASHHILTHLASLQEYDITVLGTNYRGDPHDPRNPATRANYPFPIYPAFSGGDAMGLRRLCEVTRLCKPDLIVIQTNPWNIPRYQDVLTRAGFAEIPVVGIIAVEGENCIGRQLNHLAKAIFWTEFGRDEAIKGGLIQPSDVIPLGVDTDVFTPGDRDEAHTLIGLKEVPRDAFIVGNVNRNQTRKRIDLSIMYFAEWVKSKRITDAYLYLHVLPGSSIAVDCNQLGEYCGVSERLILAEPKDVFNGAPERYVVAAYRLFNVQLSTALGEGWGLTTLEGMACGTMQIAGDFAALGEWGKGAINLVPCCSRGVMPDVNTMIGNVPDREATIAALDEAYRDEAVRQDYNRRCLARAREPQFNWANIAARYAESLAEVQ